MGDLVSFAGSGVLGSLFGGLFRLAPEIIKYFDRRNERVHEHKMFVEQVSLERQRGEFKVEERYVDFSVAQMQAVQAANEAEGKIASQSYKWVSAAVALVRPIVTYVMFLFYIAVKLTFIAAGLDSGTDWVTVVKMNWTQDDFMILTMILTFHFIGRPIEKYQRS